MLRRCFRNFWLGCKSKTLPKEVVSRTEEAFLDWFASALAGRGTRPVRILEQFAAKMGPAGGPSQILVSRKRTSPLFAALVNGAASHIAEQDDVHNSALFHPGTVVFPAVFAAAQQCRRLRQRFDRRLCCGIRGRLSAWENFSDHRITRCFTRPEQLELWAPRRELRGYSGWTLPKCSTRSVPRERRRPAFGNFWWTQPIRRCFMRERPRRTVCFRLTSLATDSRVRRKFWKATEAWRLACRASPTLQGLQKGSGSAGRSSNARTRCTPAAATRILRRTRCLR